MQHHWLTNLNIGNLIPCFLQEVTPGDTWNGSSTAVFRLSPMDYPALTQLKVFVKFFYVPHRLVWDEFPEVFAGTDTSTAWPTITYSPANLWHYFGVGTNATSTPAMNALPVRAFNLVYNEFFRNANIESERATDEIGNLPRIRFPSSDYYGGITTEIQQGTEVTVDTSGATLGTTAIRDAMNEQRWLERRALYGEKYRDVLRTDYGVIASDKSLDRPEYCAGGSSVMGISEVVATATSTGEETGEIRGHGITGVRVNFKKRRFEEPGTLIGVAYARPRCQLLTGTDRIFLTNDKDDLYNPSMASDTQVTVSTAEIYNNAASYTDFGYQFRDEWLRSPRDTIAGNLTSGANHGWVTNVELSSLPTVSYLQQVQEYESIFQDQTSGRLDIVGMFSHNIGKTSVIRKRVKR
jgi:hypothetical protein